jgi:hypothetical protein
VAAIIAIWQARLARNQVDSARRQAISAEAQALSAEAQVVLMRQQLEDSREDSFLDIAPRQLTLILEYSKAIKDIGFAVREVFGAADLMENFDLFEASSYLALVYRIYRNSYYRTAVERHEEVFLRCCITLSTDAAPK